MKVSFTRTLFNASTRRQGAVAVGILLSMGLCNAAVPPAKKPAPTMAAILAASKASDWHALDPANTLYMDLVDGRVIIELAPSFAPKHAANIKTLVHEKYFDGLAIVRSQDNYVAQWADPNAEDKGKKKSIGSAKATLAPEYTIGISKEIPFTRLPDVDGYAPQSGFSEDFWAARDPKTKETWLTHCYGAVGAGRDNADDSGPGTELYVVTGNAPRHLDRNIAVVGRVVQGMELLSSLPRGLGEMGFYSNTQQNIPIRSIRLASEVPPDERTNLEVMRTDTAAFTALVESRRNRREDWYKRAAGYVSLCNVPIPVRAVGVSGDH